MTRTVTVEHRVNDATVGRSRAIDAVPARELVDVLPLCSSDPGQDRRDRAARRALRVCSKLNLGESTACHDGDTIRIFWKAGTLVLRPDAVVWEFPERGYSNTQWVQGMTLLGWLSQDYKPEG